MRVAFLAHGLRGGGGKSVGQNLIRAIGQQAPDNAYFVSYSAGHGFEPLCDSLLDCQASVFGENSGYWARALYEQYDLPRALRSFSPDVVVGLGSMAASRIGAPQAVLVQNPHLWYPLGIAWSRGRSPAPAGRLRMRLRRARFAIDLRRTSLLLCPTETAALRVRKSYGYQGAVHLCHSAVSDRVAQGKEGERTALPLLPPAGLRLFCLTRYYAHKNLESLVDLYGAYRSELDGVIVILTLAAEEQPGARRLLQRIEHLGLTEQLVKVGPLAQEELGGYYQQCDGIILPTLLETFSMTYVEAMQFGKPILTSDRDFAREVCGDAALYFDPTDPASILETIKKLPGRSDLDERGRKRLAGFGWRWDEIAGGVLRELRALVRDEASAVEQHVGSSGHAA